MEASQSLSVESFSYSWLVNLNPSEEIAQTPVDASLDVPEEVYFIEMDPRLPSLKRSISHDFKFDFPTSQSSLNIVHADEVFCDGYVLPLFGNPSKLKKSHEALSSTSPLPHSAHAKKTVTPEGTMRSASLRRCQKLSKRIFRKYLHLFRPLFQIIGGRGSSSKAEENCRARNQVIKNLVYHVECSPRVSSVYSADEWRRSCDSESSIYEAVLHCKRSIGK